MKHDANVEYDALAWVKPELDVLLDRARQALEAYVEDQNRGDLIATAAQVLRQVRGTLQVVDLSGAVMLAEEMEALIDAFNADHVQDREAALGVLSTAVLQLPDYLEYVQSGHADSPIVILHLLNDLRAARGEDQLSEKAVFVAHFAIEEGLPAPSASSAESVESVAKAKRHTYQLSLLGVLRGQEVENNLARMAGVFAALEASSRQERLRRIWWVAGALVETLAGDVPAEIKEILGRIDREMRQLVDQGEGAIAQNLTPDLLKNLLYYVARSERGGDRAKAVREAFDLDELLPNESGLEAARQELSAPNLKLLETVSNAVREDLAEVRDQLEIYTHSDDTNAADFNAIAGKLRKISDTLGMLGLPEAHDLVAKQAVEVDAVAQGGGAAEESLLMALASTMLQTEQALNRLLQRRRGGAQEVEPAVSAEVIAAGVREALRDLNRVKDALLSYLSKQEEPAELSAVPKVLTGIITALSLIGIETPKSQLEKVKERIDGLVGGGHIPSPKWIDPLADAITAVEMYLESYAEQRPVQPAFLQRADEALEKLAELPAPNTAKLVFDMSERTAPVGETLSLASTEEFTETVGEASEVLSLTDEPLTSPSASKDVAKTAVPAQKPGNEDDPRRNLKAVREDADPEILDIFLEEAREEVDRIAGLLPRWRNDVSDEETMTSIRRSFHTLKGSGRLAGAEMLGEFAWAFESMLNRVMDQTIPLRDEHFRLLDEAVPVLRQMVEQLADGPAPQADLIELMQRAEAATLPQASESEDQPAALILGDEDLEDVAPAEVLTLASASDGDEEQSGIIVEDEGADDLGLAGLELDVLSALQSPSDEQESAAVEESEPHIDPALLDIYVREARQHLAVVDDFLSATYGGGFQTLVDDNLLIALHTLNGSARTADLPSLHRIFTPLEAIALRLQKGGRPLPQGLLGIYQDAVAATEKTLEALPHAGMQLPDTSALVERIQAALAGLEASDSLSASVPEASTGSAPTGSSTAESTPAEKASSVTSRFDMLAKSLLEEPAGGAIEKSDAPAHAEPEPKSEEPTPAVEEVVGSVSEPEHMSKAATVEELASPAKAAPPPDRGTPDLPDTLDGELVAIFLDEADELMTGSDSAIQAWESEQGDAFAAIGALQRELHTLKGGARMAGFSTIGDLTHGLESAVMRMAEGAGRPPAHGFALVHAVVDELGDMLQRARANEPVYPQTQLIGRLAAYNGQESSVVETPVRPQAPSVPPAVEAESAPSVEAVQADEEKAASSVVVPLHEPDSVPEPLQSAESPAAASPHHGTEQVRVRAELLDNLVNYAGEVNIYHARLQQQISGFGFNLNELRQTVQRLREQLRKMEAETEAQVKFRFQKEQDEEQSSEDRSDFDPLEMDRYSNIQQLSRALAESVNDLVSIEDLLAEEVRDTETLLLQQQRVSTDLQDGLMRSRMVQFGGLAPRLRRIVRQTAAELGKQAELHLSGEQSEVDRSVLDRLIAPLEHMLRNAVAHGLELPVERQSVGKPETGRIEVSVAREGSEVVVRVQDDGRGISVEAVRAKAKKQGLISADAKLDDREVIQLILETGFSTASEVSQISGRGVGMDVVVREVKQLGGMLSIESEEGRGTRFVVRLPFTLTITQALLAQAGEHLYALPLSGVEGVVRMQLQQLRDVYAEENPTYEYLGTPYAVKPLESMLGAAASPLPEQDGAHYPLLLIRSGEQRVAVQVDSLVGSREVVVKPMGPQFARLRGVAGATILGDGRVVLILDTADLVRLAGTQPQLAVATDQPAAEEEKRTPLIMVVDDSITIRKVTSRVLERNGFEVMTARDGMDAVAQLEERKPDLLLTDIEMPRMDGYELSSHVRNDTRFRSIPIIMITSRSGEKHRQRAQELGVDRYLGKPYQEHDLLDSIRELLHERRHA